MCSSDLLGFLLELRCFARQSGQVGSHIGTDIGRLDDGHRLGEVFLRLQHAPNQQRAINDDDTKNGHHRNGDLFPRTPLCLALHLSIIRMVGHASPSLFLLYY